MKYHDLLESIEYQIKWFPDIMTGNPSAVFRIGEKEWRVRFYNDFSLGNDEILDNSVECQFEEVGKSKDKWTIKALDTSADALKIIRAVILICQELPTHKADIKWIGFAANYEETSRVKLYDAICKRMNGRKISGEEFDDSNEYYAVEV